MSLVVVAEYARGPRAFAHVVALTVAIIAGLLAMHAFTSHGSAAGHGAAVGHAAVGNDAVGHGAATTHAAASGHGAAAAASSSAHQVHHGATAISAGIAPSTDHSMAWMACVLALLGAVIVFVVGVGLRLPGVRALLLVSALPRWSLVAHALPPPDLTVLCVRRT